MAAGASVLRQGAAAEAFFVIRRGSASVRRDGVDVAVLGPGDFFGELGLLRDGVRAASGVATTDLRVHVIPGGEFVRALQRFPTVARSVGEAAALRGGASQSAPGTA